MILEICLSVPLLFILWYLFKSDPLPLCGAYSQPGKWFYLKKFLFNLLFVLRQKQQQNQKNENSGQEDVGYGKKSRSSPEEMESTQPLSQEHDIDTVYFNGHDENGNCFVLRIARRINRMAEIWIAVKIAGIGFLQSPVHPDTKVYNTDGKTFSAGGLKFECLEPMRRWRVSFNGLLRKGLCNTWTEPDQIETVYVKFSFMWEAVTEVFDFDSDIHPESVSAAVAREKWTKQFFNNLRKSHQTHYEQWGELRGEVHVQGYEELKLNLKSLRDHSYGVRDWRSFHRYIIQFGWMEDGSFFHVNVISMPGSLSYLRCGYVSYPNGEIHPVHHTDLSLPDLGEDGTPPSKYSFTFKAGFRTYNATVTTTVLPEYRHHEDWGNVIYEALSTYEINGMKAYGISEFLYRDKNATNPVPPKESVPLLQQPEDIPESDQEAYCLPFTNSSCQCSSLVGGKGCQLALLAHLNSDQFDVPPGFCLTITAFKMQLEKNADLQAKVDKLMKISSGVVEGDLQSFCQEVTESFSTAPLHDDLKTSIQDQLQQVFGDDISQMTFAVRSSAAGEDSEELSAAGQMETILGVKGIESIYAAIQKCWSSHFTMIAVQYRRQHGQAICSSMGVVIQQMVKAQAAGVLFTVEPMSHNPGKMVINANYGLGESVVSGASEPDHVVVTRTWDNRCSITEKQIGSKKIQLSVSADGGTSEENVTSDLVTQCCITDEVILKLAEIGVMLEQHFSDPRDIEWAVVGDQIYLLQARPITTLDRESDWELLHEFDTPLAMNNELLTTANIGEMMPGAVTPLTYSVFFRGIEWALQEYNRRQGVLDRHKDFFKYLGVSGNNGFINMHFVCGANEENVAATNFKMAHLAVLGEVCEEMTIEGLRNYHGSSSPLRRLINGIKNFRQMQASFQHTKDWEKVLETYAIGQHCTTAQKLYQHIDQEMEKYSQLLVRRSPPRPLDGLSQMRCHIKEWSTEHYSDVAVLLSKCEDVYSADVPSALQALAEVIVEEGHANHFSNLKVEDAVEWLQCCECSQIQKKYKDFMHRHGHRCIREAEFREKSWQTEPAKLVTVLQNLVRVIEKKSAAAVAEHANVTNNEKIENIDEAIAKIKTPLTSGGKWFLKKILPRARRAVGGREWGKSVSIKMVEAFKQAYWRLADLMVKEGRLPDQDLLFFFTHQEMNKLIKTQSGALISKAQRRRKLLPSQMSLRFNKINFGHPQPVEEESDNGFVITSLKLTGLPVSRGIARGTARVVRSLEEASEIQLGDILIVHFTDVGWSPYFPLISGLVTEIGGLVSHGAVVAREYGLPCVVNCQKATQLFRSGEQVILNGSEGILEKIEDQ